MSAAQPTGATRTAARRSPPQRVAQAPGYVLHRHDWSESSVIAEVFTRTHGRLALVAKGAKRPSSNFRPVLLPLQPLLLQWGGDGEIRTLKSAEWAGGLVMPRGDALLSGCYANELLMRLLAREDPHPALFDGYAALVHALASTTASAAGSADDGTATATALAAAALRSFELLLLREAGHLPALDAQTLTLAPLLPNAPYRLVPEGGLRSAHADDAAWLHGHHWLALAAALADAAPFTAALQTIAALPISARAHLRQQLLDVLHHHCGAAPLRTRELVRQIRQMGG